jgi:hypothetical protein
MKPLHTILAAAVAATFSTGALAAGEKTEATSDRQAAQSQRDSGSGSQAAGAGGSGTQQSALDANATRDWSKVDTNNDNLIQPDEMESWLKQAGQGQTGKS